MKRSLGLCILLLFTSSCFAVRQARLPSSFYVIGKNKQPSLFDPSQDYSIIYVLVPAAAESPAEDTDAPKTLASFTQDNTLTVPASFFSADYPKAPTTPLFVYFDWKDTSPGVNQLKNRLTNLQVDSTICNHWAANVLWLVKVVVDCSLTWQANNLKNLSMLWYN